MSLTPERRIALRQKFYPTADTRTFGVVTSALDRHLQPGARVLDAGAGSGTWIMQRFAKRARVLVGADVGRPAAAPPGQPRATKSVQADLAALPFADGSFDLILCYNVVEHLPDPPAAFAGFSRLLSPGGTLIVQTPAAHSPVIWLARALPLGLHQRIKGGLGVGAEDVFPTFYRCNTPGQLDRALCAAGFEREQLVTVDQTYDYLYFSAWTYVLGLCYSRLATLPGVRRLGNTLIGVYRRAGAAG